MLVGVYRAAEWGSKLRRQHDRRVNRALESRRRRPQSHIQSSPGFQLPTSFTFWIASTVVAINTIGIFYMCFQMLVVPSVADSMQALHHHANTLTLPPSHQPTHPQWFEPTRRDHVHWMEDLASSVSSTITASRDFWTLKPHTHISNNDKVPTAPLQSSAASLAWPKSMFSDMCYAAAPDRPSKIDTLMRFEPADMCMDAVWHSTSAAAAAAEAGHLASNSPSIRLHYTVTQPSVPARNVSAPAVAVMLTRPDHTTATVPDTAVALYTPIADMGMCAANFMPAAVVFPTATAAGQSTFDTSEASTAVALYYTTPLFMPWANIFWPVINSGSTTVVTLLLSDSSVESCFNYKQDTAAAPELPMPAEPLTSNAMSVILPQLQSSFHRNAAGQEIVHQYPRPETPCSTSPGRHISRACRFGQLTAGCIQCACVLSHLQGLVLWFTFPHSQ